MTTKNQLTLASILENLQGIESGKNHGPLAEVEALATVAEDLHQLANDILSDKLQSLAEDILERCPSVESIIDAQGCDFIRHVDGSEIDSENYPVYHALKGKWSDLFSFDPGTYATRKGA